VLLLTFILNAYGMFLLVKHLTQNTFAGILSGIVFSFSSYKIMHISHLQILSSMWIPFSLLYLHKFFVNKRLKDSIWFSFFFLLQALSCIYYGLFSIAIMSLILPLFILFYLKRLNLSFILRLFIPLLLAGFILFVFSLPYLQAFKSLSLKRPLLAGAQLQYYLAAYPKNLVWGRLLSGLGAPENFLFPGLVAFVLAGSAIFRVKKTPRIIKNKALHALRRAIGIFFIIFVIINILSTFAVLLGGITIHWGIFKFSATKLVKPVLYIFVLGISYLSYKIIKCLKEQEKTERDKWVLIYSILTIWALLLSFGGGFTFWGEKTAVIPMPFSLFYNYVIGFTGIRVPSRFAVYVLLGIGVLAGFGYDRIMSKIKRSTHKYCLAIALLVIINIEYLSIPIESATIPVRSDVPLTYKWLKEQKRDAVVLEVPFFDKIGDEAICLYFSTYHKKKLINGYSGFIPASAFFLQSTFKGFPNEDCIDILEALKVDFIVLHLKKLPGEKAQEITQRIKKHCGNKLQLVKDFEYNFSKPNSLQFCLGHDLIYSFNPETTPEMKQLSLTLIPSNEWKISASNNPHLTPLMIDDNLSTRWTSSQPKKPGEFIQIDLGKFQEIARISLYPGTSYYDYGEDFKVEISEDGLNWHPVSFRYPKKDFLLSLIKSQINASQDLWLDNCETRYLKITQLGSGKEFWWSVSELKIFKASKPD